MSGIEVMRPETREELIKILTEAAKKEAISKGKPTKPTIIRHRKDIENSQRHNLHVDEGI